MSGRREQSRYLNPNVNCVTSSQTHTTFEGAECFSIKYDPETERAFIADQKNKCIIIHQVLKDKDEKQIVQD